MVKKFDLLPGGKRGYGSGQNTDGGRGGGDDEMEIRVAKIEAQVEALREDMKGLRRSVSKSWGVTIVTSLSLLAVLLTVGYFQHSATLEVVAARTGMLMKQIESLKAVGDSQTEMIMKNLESLEKDNQRSWEIANKAFERTIPPVQATQATQPTKTE